MFKTPRQLKEFILWSKKQGLKHVKVDGIEFSVSELATASQLTGIDLSLPSKEEKNVNGSWLDSKMTEVENDEDLLYASAQ